MICFHKEHAVDNHSVVSIYSTPKVAEERPAFPETKLDVAQLVRPSAQLNDAGQKLGVMDSEREVIVKLGLSKNLEHAIMIYPVPRTWH